jgi:hypothetical protein
VKTTLRWPTHVRQPHPKGAKQNTPPTFLQRSLAINMGPVYRKSRARDGKTMLPRTEPARIDSRLEKSIIPAARLEFDISAEKRRKKRAMICPPMIAALLPGTWLALAAPLFVGQPAATVAPGMEASARRAAFLERVESAFVMRAPTSLAALADVDAWRAAGYPELATLQMFLPPAPIVFEKRLAPLEVIYRDGSGRSWRLSLREVKGEFRALVRAESCPRGVSRAPQFERRERPTPKVQTWTLLECWPLPK